MKTTEANSMRSLAFGTVFIAILFLCVSVAVLLFLPVQKAKPVEVVKTNAYEALVESEKEVVEEIPVMNIESKAVLTAKDDSGLELYRREDSKVAVEWFYTHITESRDVAVAILEAADKENIPVSLAFALAYTESRYNVNAVNRNKDYSIDRGLFQLNSKSFPRLSEKEFFDPKVSAEHGMAHLRFCLNTAGNDIAALAMYNAGTNKVRNDSTPQMTLNYVSKIMEYKNGLDQIFASEVVAYYEEHNDSRVASK